VRRRKRRADNGEGRQIVQRLVTLVIWAMFATAGHAADAVKIGFLTTLSGPGGALGVDIRDGFQLGLRHAGDKLGGLPVDLTVLDDQQSPDVAKQAVERLLKQQRVDAMTGIVFSNVLLPILPGILQSETFYISPNTGPLDYAGEKCSPYFFVSSWQNEDIPGAMGKFAADKGYKSVYLIAPNYPGGRESIAGFKGMFKGQIADEVYTKMGQLDYAAELAVMRAARPDAVFMFLPGGMGINFIKQFNAGGLNKTMALLVPGFSADEDTIKAVGESLLGAYNSSQWAADLDNAPNRRFVADFQKLYGRVPTMYAAQGYDTALLLDAAVRDTKGRLEDKAAVRAALEAANFKSVRGAFRFNRNHYPIQTIYLRRVVKDTQGRIGNKLVGPLLTDHADAYAAQCKMQ
jgi:branched-chain amino acid transport system substrate-binding protein